jgi:ATP synthase protein I
MPKPDDSSDSALRRLDERLETLQAQRTRPNRNAGMGASLSEGYRLFGEAIGGVLGGFGLGWTFDHFAHTAPFGLIVGLLLGLAVSVYAAMSTALRMTNKVTADVGVAPDAPKTDDDEET